MVSANASHDGVYVCVVGVHGGGTEVMKSSQNITVIILTCEFHVPTNACHSDVAIYSFSR